MTSLYRKIIIGIVFILLISTISFFYIKNQLEPVQPNKEVEKIITIPPGSNTKEIAEILSANKLIKNRLLFQAYVKLKKIDVALQAGKYQLSTDMSLEEIVQQMIQGKTVVDIVRFTIPEGYTVEQIASSLEQKGIVNKESFLKEIEQGGFDYPFLAEAYKNTNTKYSLEGFLFPETYEMKNGSTEREIIQTMLAQFQRQWKDEWNDRLKEKKMTIEQIITIASLIEREVSVDKERPVVAGVIYNRLNKDWNLQIDATIQYILGEQKARLTFKDLEVDDPYNTYLYSGLPPGPIANPGIQAIKAALFPKQTPYYFYVTKKDGSGEHYFAKTYEEHLKNIKKSK